MVTGSQYISHMTEWVSPRASVFTTSGEFASIFTVGQTGGGWGITTDRGMHYLHACDPWPDSNCVCIICISWFTEYNFLFHK